MSPRILIAAFATLTLLVTVPVRAQDLTVEVDAREAPRGLLRVVQTFPAKPGAFAISYPKWIPGEHSPTGPNVDVAGLVLRAGERTLAWTRDPVDMNTLRVTVPAGAREVRLSFDFLLDHGTDGYTSAACATPQLLLLSWNQVAFQPAGRKPDALVVAPSLRLPDRWEYATALASRPSPGATIVFEPCSFTRLVDSPVLAGRYFRTVELTPGDSIPVRLRMASDSPQGLGLDETDEAALRRLVREARALFRSEHYRHYDFLVSLSDHVAHFGLEHHESSDNRGPERWWLDDDAKRDQGLLLAHEYAHSWNGKFRRPAGLATSDHTTPMQGELLWVYEGLTQYLGFVLAARAGLRTPDESRDELAAIAATAQARRGRLWRPLVDTGTQAQELYEARSAWATWRRGVDFYDEGLLVWLDADVTIRRLSKGARSLDDFCRAFHGGPNRGAEVKPYTLDDVIAGLEAVQPYDWRGFVRQRVLEVAPDAPLAGISAGGWRMTWADSMGPVQRSEAAVDEAVEEMHSLGLRLDSDGRVVDVVPGAPADVAGVAPAMLVVAVDGRRYSPEVLNDAIEGSPRSGRVELLCENKGFFRTHLLDYRAGLRYPALARESGTRDWLGEVLAPLAR